MSTDPQAILRARARVLARPRVIERARSEVDALEVLLVFVGDERMLIPLARVASITKAEGIVPLPRAEAPVYGVTAWRGRPLTVLSLGAATPVITVDSRFVVLGDARRAEIAVLVDSVDDALSIEHASVTPMASSSGREYISGMTEDAMLLLDVDALIRGRSTESPATPIA